MKTLLNKFRRSRLTVCDELHRQGYLTKTELKKDKAYGGANYSDGIILAYRFVILPVVLLMRVSWHFTHIVHWITSKIWFSKALGDK